MIIATIQLTERQKQGCMMISWICLDYFFEFVSNGLNQTSSGRILTQRQTQFVQGPRVLVSPHQREPEIDFRRYESRVPFAGEFKLRYRSFVVSQCVVRPAGSVPKHCASASARGP